MTGRLSRLYFKKRKKKKKKKPQRNESNGYVRFLLVLYFLWRSWVFLLVDIMVHLEALVVQRLSS